MSSIPTNSSTLVSSSSRLFSKLSTCKTHLNAVRGHNLQARTPREPQKAEHEAGTPRPRRPPARWRRYARPAGTRYRRRRSRWATRPARPPPRPPARPARRRCCGSARRSRCPRRSGPPPPRPLPPQPPYRRPAARQAAPPSRERPPAQAQCRREGGGRASRPAPRPPGAGPAPHSSSPRLTPLHQVCSRRGCPLQSSALAALPQQYQEAPGTESEPACRSSISTHRT